MLVVGGARADDVAAFLEQRGLDQLLAVHLEEQLESVGGDEREAFVLQLVGIYARLLESTDDPTLLRNLQGRSRRLLASAPPNVGEELRLALLRGSYRGAEKIAESHRLRQSTDEDVERAKETLAEIIPKLNRLRTQINSRVNLTERRLMRTGGTDAQVLADEAERIEQLRTQATFVTAWALYYQSWLNDRQENARVAEELFADILSAESSRPRPDDISVDFRAMEAMARSILGMALCKSISSSSDVAMSWVDLLTHPMAYEPIQSQVPIWRLVIHFEHGEYHAARELLASLSEGADPVPLSWIRLVAVHALEAEHGSRSAAELARVAVTTLAARGELRAVLDLAGRYGVESLGTSGFAFRYVRGVQSYQQARERHAGEQPITDEAILSYYRQAVEDFEGALAERDAEQYPEAAAGCRWLIGWCRFFEGRFLDARTSFAMAAERLGSEQAPEALWMAVVSLDYAMKSGGGDEESLRGQMTSLIDEVLDQYPLSPYTAKLRLKRALQRDPSADVVEELMSIGPDSDVYVPARRRAAQILYQLFRTTPGEGRLAYGNDYLGVALPLLVRPADGDGAAADAYVARSRRVLEVALTDGIDRLTAAGRVLAELEKLTRDGTLDPARWHDELSCRRVQERLLADDAAAAADIADALWASSAGSVWSRLAERALFRYGLARWKSEEPGSDAAYLGIVVDHGLRVLEEFDDRPDALSQTRILAWHAAVAEAMMLDWQRTGNTTRANGALALYERLLAASPTDARFLRATAILAETLSRPELALSCWRTLAAGTTPLTEHWYEARFHQISLLADSDPDRARAVMDQHKQLNPDFGPDPWGVRLRELDQRLPDAVEESSP